MKRCKRCNRLGIFLKIDNDGYCVECRQIHAKEQRLARIDKYVDDIAPYIQTAVSDSVILRSWGKDRIDRQYNACKYVLDHIDEWKNILGFSLYVAERANKTRFGYELKKIHLVVAQADQAHIAEAMDKLKAEVNRISSACLIASAHAYDYSRIFRVVGVTFKNGKRERQTILRQIKNGSGPYEIEPSFRLERYLFEGEDAVAVYADEEQVGNIARDDLKWLMDHWDEYFEVDEYDITGGGDLSYGLQIRVSFRK